MDEITEEVSELLQDLYQGRVDTAYVDVKGEAMQAYPEVAAALDRGESLPVVVINGQIKFTGYLFVPLLIQEIDGLLKIERH